MKGVVRGSTEFYTQVWVINFYNMLIISGLLYFYYQISRINISRTSLGA
jgi:hypothetical protein